MTDNEIIKALEKCASIGESCEGCPFYDYTDCDSRLKEEFHNFIKRKDAEIEQWKEEANKYQSLWCEAVNDIKTAKTEAIKEFAERLTDRICENVNRSLDNPNGNNYYPIDVYKDIDNLVKEMT